jgi:hypothetical protein
MRGRCGTRLGRCGGSAGLRGADRRLVIGLGHGRETGLGRCIRLIEPGGPGLAFGHREAGVARAREGLAPRILGLFLVGLRRRGDDAAVRNQRIVGLAARRPPDRANDQAKRQQPQDQETHQLAGAAALFGIVVLTGFEPRQAHFIVAQRQLFRLIGRAANLRSSAENGPSCYISSTASTPSSASPLRTSWPTCAAR